MKMVTLVVFLDLSKLFGDLFFGAAKLGEQSY